MYFTHPTLVHRPLLIFICYTLLYLCVFPLTVMLHFWDLIKAVSPGLSLELCFRKEIWKWQLPSLSRFQIDESGWKKQMDCSNHFWDITTLFGFGWFLFCWVGKLEPGWWLVLSVAFFWVRNLDSGSLEKPWMVGWIKLWVPQICWRYWFVSTQYCLLLSVIILLVQWCVILKALWEDIIGRKVSIKKVEECWCVQKCLKLSDSLQEYK